MSYALQTTKPRTLPISLTFKGELHQVRLINFSIDPAELEGQLPEGILPHLVDGRALISMVDVRLRHMRLAAMPPLLHFGYRHLAFRLLVDDRKFGSDYQGIYFLRSFTDRPWIALGGALLTNYHLGMARINENKNGAIHLQAGGHHLHYRLDDTHIIEKKPWLRSLVSRLDRAYAPGPKGMEVTQIQRERWPIDPVACTEFSTSFFKTARLEGAFRVKEKIDYTWLPAKPVEL